VNLNRLRYFVAVADELHFGRAAARLHMAQPPLSQQIRQLESELDATLFERTTRRVALTEAGRLLYPHARRVLGAADDAAAVMASVGRGEAGVLRLGFVDSASYDVLPRFLRSYRERLPSVEYELHTLSSDQQHRALVEREIDLGLGRVDKPGSPLTSTPFLDERLYVAIPTDHPLAGRAVLPVEALSEEPFIGFDRAASPSLFRDLVAMFAARGHDYDPIIEATEYATVLGLVASGQGLAVVPASVRSFQPPGLSYVPFDESARTSLMLLSRTDDPSPLVAQALDVVDQVFGRPRSEDLLEPVVGEDLVVEGGDLPIPGRPVEVDGLGQ
jgi:DNA-binding transcriptional LysR family regulator